MTERRKGLLVLRYSSTLTPTQAERIRDVFTQACEQAGFAGAVLEDGGSWTIDVISMPEGGDFPNGPVRY